MSSKQPQYNDTTSLDNYLSGRKRTHITTGEEDEEKENSQSLGANRVSSLHEDAYHSNKRVMLCEPLEDEWDEDELYENQHVGDDAKRVQCPKCLRIFCSSRNLKRHLRTMDRKYNGVCRAGRGRVTHEEELELIAIRALQDMSQGIQQKG